MWVNGMLNEDNPLVHGQLDEDRNDLEFYGVDPDGRSPFKDSNNNVVLQQQCCTSSSDIAS